jgi:DNA invertase Pin-like site-specific DNA recombinase
MNMSYERVSTIKQDVRRQELSFDNYNIAKKYIDKASGKNVTDRPQLNKLMNEVKSGDNIYVESISRLGRNVDDLRKLTEYFREKGVIVHFLKEGFNTNGNMYKFLLTILGAVAEMEREITISRIKEGMEKAKKYGTKSGIAIGRPIRKLPKDFKKYYTKWKKKEIKAVEFARLINVSRATLYRYINDYEKLTK